MARKKQTRGECVFCGKEMTRGGLTKHLASCIPRHQKITEATQRKGENQTIYHLQVLDAWAGDFWLQLEMNGTASLEKLDSYLRSIWLECCGHLSMFSFGGWAGEEIAMSRKLEQVVDVGNELTHIYDFGTSSETLVRVVGKREGKPLSRRPIKLMARNRKPEMQCDECGSLADWWCPECTYELDKPGLLCEKHMENHPHDDYGEPLPLVNSPRAGMCGYEGPAEPPY